MERSMREQEVNRQGIGQLTPTAYSLRAAWFGSHVSYNLPPYFCNLPPRKMSTSTFDSCNRGGQMLASEMVSQFVVSANNTFHNMQFRRKCDITNDIRICKKTPEQNPPENNTLSTTRNIFTFHSCRLSVNFRGADIDALLVVPRFITRERFVSEFQALSSEDDSVEDLHAVPHAYVPLLKLKCMSFEVDLLLAQIDSMPINHFFTKASSVPSSGRLPYARQFTCAIFTQ
ncbi:unnamed protein product [Mesocestoides corti]|uniref:Poly(A) polymerase nucleotidyltransferase domain-containing protein n=1 Tax=Mesocestoides corti TaxID=53468 RepID=A0A3P6GI01_MESCO|nr:unnamed protein product [Mesocestoides corti]